MNAPIVTGEVVPDTTETWMVLLFLGGMIITVSTIIVILLWNTVFEFEETAKFTVLSLSSIVVGVILAVYGGWLCLDNWASDNRELNNDRLIAAIEDQYDVTALKYLSDKGEGVVDTHPSWKDLCRDLTTDSPRYAGIVNGQEVEMRIAVKGCESSDPTVLLSMTKTPGQKILPEDIAK